MNIGLAGLYIHTHMIYFKQIKSLAAWKQADVDLQKFYKTENQ